MNAHPQVLAHHTHILSLSLSLLPGQWLISKDDLVPQRTSGNVCRYYGQTTEAEEVCHS